MLYSRSSNISIPIIYQISNRTSSYSYTTQRNKKKSFTSFPKNFPADILKGDPLHIENFLFTPSRVFPFSPFL